MPYPWQWVRSISSPSRVKGYVRHCPDCGSAMEPEADASYRICQGCYDAYVDHAGR